MTTPDLNVLQIKRTRGVKHYCHITHHLTPGTYRVFGLDYFDSILVANKLQKDFIKLIESKNNLNKKYIKVVGSTYLDELYKLYIKEPKKLDSNIKTILVSPSWGKESILFKYGLTFLKPLAESNFNIIIRPHPQSYINKLESNNIEFLKQNLKDYKNISWDTHTNNIHSFKKSDLMISDFSSVIFDYALLVKKPIITMDFTFDTAGYDLSDLNKEELENFYTFKKLKEIGVKLKESDFNNISSIIQQAIESKNFAIELEKLSNEIWTNKLDSAFYAVKEILEIQRNILESKLDSTLLNDIRNLDHILYSTFNRNYNA